MTRFPTRSYPYKRDAFGGAAPAQAAPPGGFYGLVLGRDAPPGRPVGVAETSELNDAFAVLVLRAGAFPLTLTDLLVVLDQHNGSPDGLPEQRSFVVAEGGQIPRQGPNDALDRGFRFVIARARAGDTLLLVSTSFPFDSQEIFLQVLSWDSVKEVYHYYERRAGSWFWAGSSPDALSDPTRGQGPFDSHVNGSLVMKELKNPWLHWNSQAQQIGPDVLPAGDPVRLHPLFTRRQGAERLETEIIKPGITRWTAARLRKSVEAGRIKQVRALMRQILTTTTVNIASSPQATNAIEADKPLLLPTTFFLNIDGLVNAIGLEPDVSPIEVTGARYLASLKKFEVSLRDTNQGFSLPGDTFFAFPVPEPAFEDVSVLDQMLQQGMISKKFAACLLMVDFSNPIGSRSREGLMAFVDDFANVSSPGSIEDLMLAALSAAPNGPAVQVVDDMALSDSSWKGTFEDRIARYFEAITMRVASQDGMDDFLRLAESRRRAFRKRPLAEFDLTLPWTNLPPESPPLRMTAAAQVEIDT